MRRATCQEMLFVANADGC